jgi:hypothetical protein
VTLSSTLEKGMLKFWDMASGGELMQAALDGHTEGIAISPAGDVLARVGPVGVRHWDVWPLDRIDQVTAAFPSPTRRASAPAPEEPDPSPLAGPSNAPDP